MKLNPQKKKRFFISLIPWIAIQAVSAWPLVCFKTSTITYLHGILSSSTNSFARSQFWLDPKAIIRKSCFVNGKDLTEYYSKDLLLTSMKGFSPQIDFGNLFPWPAAVIQKTIPWLPGYSDNFSKFSFTLIEYLVKHHRVTINFVKYS